MGIAMNKREKIAVIGMGGLFPGSETVEQFWENLLGNKDLVSQARFEDFGADPALFYHEEKGKLDHCYSLRGGFIRDFQFDAKGYFLEENLLNAQDNQFKWSLYVAKAALQASGYFQHPSLEKCGVIVGNLSFPTRYSRQILSPVYAEMASEVLEELSGQKVSVPASNTRYPADIQHTLLTNAPAALIAQALGLRATHYSLDAACASSLYAIKLACDELQTGKADLMLAGAVSGADPLFIHMGFSYFHAYARENEVSAPMDTRSGGLTSAEGAGMIVLKRLSDARRDGDRILAVIEGVGLSNDGKGKFLLSPNPKGQKLAFERAYSQTDLRPEAMDYLECHATGTPLGDKTEFNSISDFFAPNGTEAPLVGSVKSNMGHLLTAAGMAGMVKVILSMQHRIIPATIKISEPLRSDTGKIGDAQIVSKNRPWKNKGKLPHAGINAFGFGGTNAHLILSAHDERETASPAPPQSVFQQKIAIVGMDVHFGDCDGLEAFYLSLFGGRRHFTTLPEERWKGMERLNVSHLPDIQQLRGVWLKEYDLDLLRFKIQPLEAERLTRQQTLMLKVAYHALKDAGLEAEQNGSAANVAVITAMESELEIHHRMGRWDLSWQVNQALEKSGFQISEASEATLGSALKNAIFQAYEDHSPSEHTGFIGNIISSRIAALMDFTGPAFTVSSNENAVYKALEIARNLLAMKEVDAVVLGAIDLSGSLESVLSRQALNPVQNGETSMGWNDSSNGWLIGEGAGAVVLKRAENATRDRVYAFIDDLAIVQSEHTDLRGKSRAKAVENAARTVLSRQTLQPSDIGILEASASGIPAEDRAEMEGLGYAYRSEKENLTCAVGSAKTHIGHCFSASGMASLVKTALSLYHRFIPGVPGWEKLHRPELLAKTPFYFPEESRPWIPEKEQTLLRAAVSGLASDGTAAHVLLSEGHHPAPEKAGSFLLKGGERLFPIRANSADALVEQLREMESQLNSKSFRRISDEYCERFENQKLEEGCTTVLVAASEQVLRREIKFFQEKIADAWANSRTLQTPSGSYFSAKPLGKKGKIALVYPGSGTVYVGMGAAVFQAFPGLYDAVKSRVNHLDSAFFSADLYPRRRQKLDASDKKAAELALQTNALPMMAIGCTFAAVYTALVQDFLGLKADSVAGFSMGETSAMWYGQGIWDAHRAEEKFIEAPLFREKVGGQMSLLAEVWNMTPDEARARWSARLVTAPEGVPGFASLAEWFRKVVAPTAEKIFLTFIHTDNEVVISGDSVEIERLLEQYPFANIPLALNNVVHHNFCRTAETEFLEMHRLPIEHPADKDFYSSITLSPLKIETESLAKNATDVCCEEVDFPRLVRKMADEGHRIFVELGANATCSRWIGEILAGQEHLAVPADRKGASALRNICGLVATLLSHEVSLDIRHFYEPEASRLNKPKELKKTLRTGGPRFETVALGEEQRQLFAQIKSAKKLATTPSLVLAGASDETDFWSEPPSSFTSNTDLPDTEKLNMNTIVENKKTLKKAENGLDLQDFNDPLFMQGKTVIWDEKDLLTFATGKISDVFGPEYAIIDTYRRRVMLPMPPYLLVSRVTRLEARMNEYKPSLVTTEYDIPYGSDFATDGQIPWAVAVESGQCDLLLISYLGIDFQNKGDYVYRLLDCTLTFLDDLPFEGQTLRYDIRINSFVRSGNNLLFFFSYECFVQDRMVLKMDGGCAGFFNNEELAQGQGVVYKPQELVERQSRARQYFAPLLSCDKTVFSREDLLALTRGDLVSCFGEIYHPTDRNPSLRLPPEKVLMLDRITKLERQGGSAGLGWIEAEKDLLPEDWYFPCHFRDDEVLAGSLQAEGGGQLLRFFMLYLGMQRLTKDARFQPVLDVPQKVRCRKEVPAKKGVLIYRMDVKAIGLVPEPYVIADLEILYDGYVAVFFENLGLRLQEKNNPTYLKNPANLHEGIFVKPVPYPVLLNEYHVTQFALGPVYKCFGEEYKVYEGRELSRQPNTDLQFISRVREVQGQRHVFNNKPVVVAEYDVPADAWYFEQNAAPEMPYSVLMEVALQPCGFLGAYLGSTLAASEKDLFFRNLDGDGELLREVDLRGKTVVNHACLVSHTSLGGTVLQRYTFELSVDGAVFYKGNSSFGFFTKDDLSSQAGLDQGQHKLPWLRENPPPAGSSMTVKTDSLFGKMKLFKSADPASPRLHLAGNQLRFLDTATIVRDGGKYGKGYIFASKIVLPHDWYFTCHFYQDPVMPGSLGVEAIIQAIQLFALQQGLGEGLKNAIFQQPAPHRTVWKYRGQILQKDPEMHLEAHIKEVKRENGRVLLLADASLWKGSLRIYEVTDLAVLLANQK
jgi:PfaB family protein